MRRADGAERMLSPSQWTEAKRLFSELSELDPDLRTPHLEASGVDDESRQQVLKLLEAFDGGSEFLSAPTRRRSNHEPGSAIRSGQSIAGYTIVREIGRGGMGTVYEAIQARPKRRVALKVLRADISSQRTINRFVREGEVLARLDHPGVARVFETGRAEDADGRGRPFISMQFIEHAAPVTAFVQEGNLDDHKKLQLMVAICEAVHYGHQRGIIHRDIKPNNLLVGADGVPRIIDFGVARTVDAEESIAANDTIAHEILGTLRYMSPEQCAGRANEVDVRTDVYALGVVLFEVLLGHLPYDFTTDSLVDIPRVIVEHTPLPPSRKLDADLQAIIYKSLEKRPDDRYASADALASDIRRYLAGQPIEAKRDRAVYVLTKTLRRYRRTVSLVASAFVLLTLVAAWLGLMYVRAERDAAELRRLDYLQTIALAERELESSRTGELRRLLDSCPEELRGWEWGYLYRRADESIATIQTRPYVAGAVSPDGRLFATGTRRGFIEIWDIGSQVLVTDVDISANYVESLSFSSDGMRLAVGTRASADDYIIDMATMDVVVALDADEGVKTVHFVYHTDELITAAADGSIHVRDPATGRVLDTLASGGAWATALASNIDGSLLLSGHEDGSVRCWDLTGRELLFRTHVTHSERVSTVALSDDGQIILSGSWDNTLRTWTPDGRQADVRMSNGDLIRAISLSGNGATLLVVTPTTVEIRDGDSRTLTRQLVGQSDGLGGTLLPTMHGEGRLLTWSYDSAQLWSARPRTGAYELLEGQSRIDAVAESSCGRWMAASQRGGDIQTWDGDRAGKSLDIGDGASRVYRMAFSPTGKHLAAVCDDSSLRIWNVETGALVHNARSEQMPIHVAWSAEDVAVVATHHDTIAAWRVGIETPIWERAAEQGGLGSVAVSCDLATMASGGRDGSVKIWNLEASGPEPIAMLEGHSALVGDLAGSPDGKALASGSNDEEIVIWDVASQTLAHRLFGHEGLIKSVDFDPSSTRLVSAGWEGPLRLWDTKSGELILRLQGHRGIVMEAEFSQDGHRIISGGSDGSVRVWEAGPVDRSNAP